MKKIPIGGKNALRNYTIIDDEDYERVSRHKWHDTGEGYIASWIGGKEKQILLHRFILNPPNGKHIDHINHDTYDNTKENLRICTQKENAKNRISIVPDGYYTRQKTKEKLNLSDVTLAKYIRRGEITKYKYGYRMCFNKSEIDRLALPPKGFIDLKALHKMFFSRGLNYKWFLSKGFIAKQKQLDITYYNKKDAEDCFMPRIDFKKTCI